MVREPIQLLRDCEVTTIPYGQKTMLEEGEYVEIAQQLGSSVTVNTQYGLVRVDGHNLDAIGLEVSEVTEEDTSTRHSDEPFDMERVTDALSTIYDPEIPVSIVELGLVYRCDEIITESGSRRIEIDMSMTAPGCGMGDVLRMDAMQAVQVVPGVDEVEVNVVWDPPWDASRLSDAARLQLGMY